MATKGKKARPVAIEGLDEVSADRWFDLSHDAILSVFARAVAKVTSKEDKPHVVKVELDEASSERLVAVSKLSELTHNEIFTIGLELCDLMLFEAFSGLLLRRKALEFDMTVREKQTLPLLCGGKHVSLPDETIRKWRAVLRRRLVSGPFFAQMVARTLRKKGMDFSYDKIAIVLNALGFVTTQGKPYDLHSARRLTTGALKGKRYAETPKSTT